jgi:uncharacterized protein (TIGR03382 family)
MASDDGGCNCSAAGSKGTGIFGAALLLLGILSFRRRASIQPR